MEEINAHLVQMDQVPWDHVGCKSGLESKMTSITGSLAPPLTVYVVFLISVTKCLTRGLLWLRVTGTHPPMEEVMVARAWGSWSHLHLQSGSEEMNTGAHPTLSLYSVQDSSPQDGTAYIYLS